MIKKTAPVGRPIDRNKDEAIINASCELIAASGLQSVTMEAVAKKAGISKATLYSRYANRDQLIWTVVHCQSETLIDDFNVELKVAADIETTLIKFGHKLLNFLLTEQHINLMKAIFSSPDVPQSLLDSIYQLGAANIEKKLLSWLQQAHDAGFICCPNPDKSCDMLCSLLIGMDWLHAFYGQPFDRSEQYVSSKVQDAVASFLVLHKPAV